VISKKGNAGLACRENWITFAAPLETRSLSGEFIEKTDFEK